VEIGRNREEHWSLKYRRDGLSGSTFREMTVPSIGEWMTMFEAGLGDAYAACCAQGCLSRQHAVGAIREVESELS